jgi:signal peptidase II
MTRFIPFALAVAVWILDRVTKNAIRARVSAFDNIPVIPGFFSIVHAENPGAAFGFLAESGGPLRSLFLIGLSSVVIVLICYLLWNPKRAGLGDSWLSRAGLACVLGGAAGNLFDRSVRGVVTDFLEFYFGSYQFPAFNVADTAITVGAGLLLLEMWTGRHRDHPAGESRGSA